MLTPIDVQNKEFKGGIGFDKREVESFMQELSADYETLYRSNIELKDKVSALNESLQHYRSIEDSMQKALTISEKTAEETVSAANEKARQLNIEAEKKAEAIVEKAKDDLLDLKNEIHGLTRQYEIFKNQFTHILESQLKLVNGEIEEIDLGPGFENNYEGMSGFPYMGFPNPNQSFGGLGSPYAGNNMDRFAQTNQAPTFDRGPLNMDPFADAMNGGGRFSRQTGRAFVSSKRKNANGNDALKIKNTKKDINTNIHKFNSDINQATGEVEDKIFKSSMLDSEDNYGNDFEFINEEETTNAFSGEIEEKVFKSSMLDSEDNYADGFDFLDDDDDEIPTILANPTSTYSKN